MLQKRPWPGCASGHPHGAFEEVQVVAPAHHAVHPTSDLCVLLEVTCTGYKQDAWLVTQADSVRPAAHLQPNLAWDQGQRRYKIQVGDGQGGGMPVGI